MRRHCRSLCTYARARGGDDDDDDDGRVGANVKNACAGGRRGKCREENILQSANGKNIYCVYI